MATRRRDPLALQEAKVEIEATSRCPTKEAKDVRPDLIDRIKKCFDRANHANANEAEAQAAMRMASKIMESHNIELAQVMQHEDSKEQAQRGGLSTVVIRQPKEPRVVKYETWVGDLIRAVQKFFDCRAYSKQRRCSITWTFYGIAEHTVAAANAFELMHYLILDGSSTKIEVTTRNSYCLGAAHGLSKIAKEEAKALDRAAREMEERSLAKRVHEEKLARGKEIARFQQLQPSVEDEARRLEAGTALFDDDEESCSGFSDPDDDLTDEDDLGPLPDNNPFDEEDEPDFDAAEGDLEAALQQFKKTSNIMKPQSIANLATKSTDSPVKTIDLPKLLDDNKAGQTGCWNNLQQLTLFRKSAKAIAQSVLEEQKIKLTHKKRKRSVKDHEAFSQGKKDSKDSKDINERVKRPRIEGKKGEGRGNADQSMARFLNWKRGEGAAGGRQ